MGKIVNGKIEGECSPCEPLFFGLAINCRDEGVLCKGKGQTLIRAKFFPFPYDPLPFSNAAKGVSPLETPAFAGLRSCPERNATLVPSGTRPLFRARRDHCSERDATLVPSETGTLNFCLTGIVISNLSYFF